jgi:hypothetical protein
MLIMHDNAPVHTSASVREFLAEKGVTTLYQPAHHPDMHLCDRFVFRMVENGRWDYNLQDSHGVKSFLTEVISAFTLDTLSDEFNHLCADLQCVIDCGGDYL